jgi:hypothetical protein
VDVIAWRWADVGEERGWGYPLELSSSIYPTATLRAITARYRYDGPNQLESALHDARKVFASKPMLCLGHSVAFSAVWNAVQAGQGWAADAVGMTEAELADEWDTGRHLDWRAYNGWEHNAYHALPPVRFVDD